MFDIELVETKKLMWEGTGYILQDGIDCYVVRAQPVILGNRE